MIAIGPPGREKLDRRIWFEHEDEDNVSDPAMENGMAGGVRTLAAPLVRSET